MSHAAGFSTPRTSACKNRAAGASVAYDIAGRGIADCGSLIEAVRVAARLARAELGSAFLPTLAFPEVRERDRMFVLGYLARFH